MKIPLEELNDAVITIQDYITVKIINSLGLQVLDVRYSR